jgi:hypothetical protein
MPVSRSSLRIAQSSRRRLRTGPRLGHTPCVTASLSIRVAVVAPPGSLAMSSRFGEMLAEESHKGYFRIFDAREPAVAWLEDVGDEAGGG